VATSGEPVTFGRRAGGSWAPARLLGGLWWAARLAAALFVFVGALQLMKTGAASLSILHQGGLLVQNAGSTLGLGWLGALLVLSGSPIAATSLTLVAAGEQATAGAERFTELQGFTMLTGSRLGAAFVVLVTAVLFALRAPDGERKAPVTCAMFALFGTAMIYVPAAFVGAALLRWESFHSVDLTLPGGFVDLLDLVYGGLLERAEQYSPALVFLVGLACLLAAFKLIDTVLPTLDPSTLQQSRAAMLTRKWPMFFLGCLVALVTMSISVALTVLVPLVAKRYVKVDHVLPYILGANITTLGDTMFAAFTLDSPAAVRIVLAEVIATSALSLVLLAFFYPQILKAMWHVQVLGARSPRRLAVFTGVLFLLPITIIAVSALFG
jgi:sodium-dependent phosphate cotransporter